jgi:AcrR family transcriptional regulator
MSEKGTRERILDAAEKLFSEHGFTATSVRAITAEAEVNLAALNYHFGTKDTLVDAVLSRRIKPLNRERLNLLDQLEKAGSPTLEQLLEAFLRPALQLASDPGGGGHQFMRLMGRSHGESRDFFLDIITKHFKELFNRYEPAFEEALPGLPTEELFWRLHFVIGAMAHTMAHALSPLRVLNAMRTECTGIEDIRFEEEDVDVALDRLVQFSAAGLRAEVQTLEDSQK